MLNVRQIERLRDGFLGAADLANARLSSASSTRSSSAPSRVSALDLGTGTVTTRDAPQAITEPLAITPQPKASPLAITQPLAIDRRRQPPQCETQQQSKRMRLDGGLKVYVKLDVGDPYYLLNLLLLITIHL